jgi:RNA polymerase sigma factor (TIGR02999 family)
MAGTVDRTALTELLAAAGQGNDGARERLWNVIYEELHRVAHRQMAAEPAGPALQTTVLVHEAYLRLVGDDHVQWANRRHFFAAAANAMRRIRVDYARMRDSLKRGGRHAPSELTDGVVGTDGDPAETLALDEALKKLEVEAPRAAEVVNLRFFAGLSVAETAAVLEISPRTVELDWRFGRAWLRQALSGE